MTPEDFGDWIEACRNQIRYWSHPKIKNKENAMQILVKWKKREMFLVAARDQIFKARGDG